MGEPPRGIEEYLDHCFHKFFAPLIAARNLSVLKKQVDGLGGLYEAAGESLRVRLVNDRGLASFEIGPVAPVDDYWDVELVSGLFDPPHIHRKGVRRLNLEEQSALLVSRWSELTLMFADNAYASTRARLHKLGLERANNLFGHDAG